MSNVPSDLPRIEAAAADAGATATSPPAATANPGESRRDVVRRLSLDAFLPYRLRNLAQTVSASFAAVYSPAYGITPPEWRIIATVCEFQQTTATEISRHSGMHKATISRAVLSLEKRQLLLRSPSAADRREEILTLTPEGRRIYDRIGPMALHYEQSLLEGLSQDDIARLDELIHHLMERAGKTWFGADEPL